MAEENSSASPIGIVRVSPAAPAAHLRDVMGPLMVDQAIRQALQQCWMALPEKERTPDRVEHEILRVVHRALRDMREDAAAFGFSQDALPQ